MNIENDQEKSTSYSIGIRLRIARENMNLTQQKVADRLCLKLSTIQSIENDKLLKNLSSIFVRGYIRSYARLVNITEDNLIPNIVNQQPLLRMNKIKNIKNFSSIKKRKKRDIYLIIVTILVIFTLISFTTIWWWQNYNFSKKELKLLSIEQKDRNVNNNQSLNKQDINLNKNLNNQKINYI